ncbi:diphthine synthase [Candidatus Bathyarchaeota archaeon]|nr:diphthine synthase [Candidatus Bathyarchaeota archaeon]
MTLKLVSIGLRDHLDLSLRAIEEIKTSEKVYFESYTMKLDTNYEQLEETTGKKVSILERGAMEEEASNLLREAAVQDISILVGGDALSATTHVSLLIDAKKQGIDTKVIHGASILTAIAETGLSIYKFGRTVTVPLPQKGPVDTVIRTLRENREHGLHTLLLLDLNIPGAEYLTIPQALIRLIDTDEFPPETLVVGLARIGSENQIIRADKAAQLISQSWGETPHAIVVPGRLHFLEEEALKVLADCPPELLEGRLVMGEVERLIDKYSRSCRKVLDTMVLEDFPMEINEKKVQELIDHTERYLSDTQYYWGENNPVALTSVAYAEGILDALKLLGLADFQW